MNTKRKLCMAVLFAISSMFVMAQGNYYLSLADYWNRKMEYCPSLEVKPLMKKEKVISATCGLKVATGDKKMDKMLRKKAAIIEKGDSVFVNYREVYFKNKKLGTDFGSGLRIKNKIFFCGPPAGSSKVLMAGMLLGVVGSALAAIAEAKNPPSMRLFMLNENSKDARLVKKEYLGILLSENEKLKIAYLSEDKPEDYRVIWKYLQKLAER